MKKFIIGLAALPFVASVASAGQPLTNDQMDQVTAGFSSLSYADAQALGKIVASATATLSQVNIVTTSSGGAVSATYGETTLNLIKSLAASQSASTATNTLPTTSLGLSSPSCGCSS